MNWMTRFSEWATAFACSSTHATVVEKTLLGTTLGGLLLLLSFDLGGRRLDLTGTSERAVN